MEESGKGEEKRETIGGRRERKEEGEERRGEKTCKARRGKTHGRSEGVGDEHAHTSMRFAQ